MYLPMILNRLINLNISNSQLLVVNNTFESKLRNGVISRSNSIGIIGNKFNS